MALIQRASPKELAEIAGTSLTGSYQAVYTASDDVIILVVTSTCDQDIYISLDGTTTHYKLSSSNKGFVLDFTSNFLRLPKPIVSVKHAGVVPTAGWLAVSATELTT